MTDKPDNPSDRVTLEIRESRCPECGAALTSESISGRFFKCRTSVVFIYGQLGQRSEQTQQSTMCRFRCLERENERLLRDNERLTTAADESHKAYLSACDRAAALQRDNEILIGMLKTGTWSFKEDGTRWTDEEIATELDRMRKEGGG
jgi:hypothetical protein